jgi:Holliday junction resolvase RusA-like endonuclease
MILHISELPPPLSACFNNAKDSGRVKTKRYKDWIELASTETRRQLMLMFTLPITAPIAVTYSLVKPDNRKRDLGNLEKGLSDILVSTGIIEDDSLIEDLRLKWVESEHPVTIEIQEIGK